MHSKYLKYGLCFTAGFGLLLFVFSGCRQKQEAQKAVEFKIDKPYERGPLSVHLRLDKDKLTIAESLLLELETAIGPGYEIKMPKIGEQLMDFGILDWSDSGKILGDKNVVLERYRYRLEPLLSGSFEIPAFKFEFFDVNDPNTKSVLETEPLKVEVASLLGEERSKLIIADIENVVDMPSQSSYLFLWAGLAAAASVVIGLWIYLRREKIKKAVRIFKPAHEIAYERLRVLVAEDLIKAGKLKEFYERISNILRHYIEDRFDLHAPERTTEEFLAEIQFSQVLASDDKESIGNFLKHCDLVKFAKYNPTTEQIQKTFDLVKEFIEKTKAEERKMDVTDMLKQQEAAEVRSD